MSIHPDYDLCKDISIGGVFILAETNRNADVIILMLLV